MRKGQDSAKSIKSLSTLGVKAGGDVIPVLLHHFLQDPEGLLVIGACESRFHRASVINHDKAVPLDPVGVKRQPVIEIISTPNPTDFLGNQLHILDLVKGDSLGNANWEVVGFDCDPTFPDLDVLIVVDNRCSSVHNLYL